MQQTYAQFQVDDLHIFKHANAEMSEIQFLDLKCIGVNVASFLKTMN